MERKSATIHRKMLMLVSQLPITKFAHKAANGRRPLPAATGIARSAREQRHAPIGLRRVRPSCCRCPTTMSSSHCRRRQPRSRSRASARSTPSCSVLRPIDIADDPRAGLSWPLYRVALANSRLTRLGDDQVDFTWKDYRHHGKTKVMTLAADEFIRRFLLHAIPDGVHRIRHIGFLANGQVGAVPCFARSPNPRSATAGELPRAHTPADRPCNRRLPALWRRDAGARTAAAPSTAASTILA
jgi:Putative transposase